MYGVMSSQVQMSYAYSAFMNTGMGFSNTTSPSMMSRMMKLQMMMGSMMGMGAGMMMPMMSQGLMANGMGMNQNMGAMNMFGAAGQMGGATPFGMSSFGQVGVFGASSMGQSMSEIMGGGSFAGAFAGPNGSFAFAGSGGAGAMQQTTEVGAVGAFGFRNRVEKDPFGTGGGGMGGNRNANLANSPEAVLALDNLLNKGVNNFDELSKQLKDQYGIEAKVSTVDGAKTLTFPNGDHISDGNGNNILDKDEYNFKDSIAQIKKQYGMDSNLFDLRYNQKLTPEQRQSKIEGIMKERESEYTSQLKKMGYNDEQTGFMSKMYRFMGGSYGLTGMDMMGTQGMGITPQWGVNTPESQFYGPQFLGGAAYARTRTSGMGMYMPMMSMFSSAYSFAG